MIQKPGPWRVKQRFPQPRVVVTGTSIELNNGVPTGNQYSGGPLTVDSGKVEKIAYTCRNKGFPLLSNSCAHFKGRSWYNGDATAPFTTQNHPIYNNYGYREFWTHHTASNAHVTALDLARRQFDLTLGPAVLGVSAQAFINEATTRLRPDLTTVSIPNFIAELGDVKRMFQIVQKSAGLAKNLAGAHLNYKFGWKPFIGDLQDLYKGVKSLHDKLVEWEKSINVLFSKSCSVLADTTTKIGSAPIGPHWVTWTATIERHAYAHLKWKPHPLGIMKPFEKSLRAVLDTIGFELNPRIIWDALPFTFVLDWFFDVGSFLGNFKIDTLELPIEYVDSAVSYKEVFRCVSEYHEASAIWYPRIDCPAWVTVEEYFHRVPIFADYYTLCQLSGRIPKVGQLHLLFDLAVVLGMK